MRLISYYTENYQSPRRYNISKMSRYLDHIAPYTVGIWKLDSIRYKVFSKTLSLFFYETNIYDLCLRYFANETTLFIWVCSNEKSKNKLLT